MTKYTRVTGKVFGASADPTGDNPEIGQFGSALATTYLGTSDISTIQSLPAWSNGFIGCVTPNTQFPPLPEMTGFGKVLSQQICYLLQQGIAEYDSGTTYYDGNWCAYNKNLYTAKADGFSNVAPTDTTKWDKFTGGFSRNYGEIVTSSLPITDATLHLADGSLLNNTDYPEFVSYVANLYNSLPSSDFSQAVQNATLGNNDWYGIAYGSNKYVAINGNGNFSTSTDGITWTTPSTMLSSYTDQTGITYGNGKFLCITNDGIVLSSTDGETWSLTGNAGNYNYFQGLAYGNGKFIAIGQYGKVYLSSDDGANWTNSATLGTGDNFKALTFNGNNFVALTGDTFGYVYTSPDGTNWTYTQVDNLKNYHFGTITYDGIEFLAISTEGYISTSNDGITWTAATQNTNLGSHSWNSSVFNNLEIVALSKTGYISKKQLSPTNVFTTEANWQATYTAYGECGKYVYDSVNNTVRIPLYNSYLTNTTNPQKLGNLTEASLPNIRASVSNLVLQDGTNYFDWQGAFYNAGIGGKSYRATNVTEITTNVDNIGFNANNYNSIYKDTATTVNTQSIKQLVYIVVGK